MLFCQVGLNVGHSFAFTDVKAAFCQSHKLRRKQGPLYATPCEGLSLPEDALIEIVVPVYGLEDAPYEWRCTVLDYLKETMNFSKSILEPCWLHHYDAEGNLDGQILLEVDDFIISAKPDFLEVIKRQLHERFHFGKWECNRAEYSGRNIVCHHDRICMDQEKYIIEHVHPISLSRARRAQRGDPLTQSEFEQLRSLVYRINWVARETRPEVSGTASIMASKLQKATVADILVTNRAVAHLRGTASRPLILWKFNPFTMAFIAVSDAGGVSMNGAVTEDDAGLPSDATQGAWMVLTAERLPSGQKMLKASPVSWKSSKLKRKVLSTFGGETQAMLQGVSEVDWLQILYRDAIFNDVSLRQWRQSLRPHLLLLRDQCELRSRQKQCLVTDAKSLYDCILKEHPSGKQDRKASLELAIIVKDLQDTKSMVKWVPHQKLIVDTLTKDDIERGNGALLMFLKSGMLSFVQEDEELKNRRENASFRKRGQRACMDRIRQEEELTSLLHTLWCWRDDI